MAEALAVVGIIANIISLIDFSVEVYDRAKSFSDDVKDIPKAFRNIRNVLPLVSNSLQQSQRQIEAGEIDQSTCSALKPSLESCKDTVVELKELFAKVLPADGVSRITRGWKAVSSLGMDKKVEDLNKAMMQYVGVLTLHHVSKGAKKQEELARKSLFMVRYRKEEEFIGRQNIMEEIAKRFQANAQRVAVAGIGGVGKSRIAIEYCYQYHAENPDAHVFWVHGGSRDRFQTAYRDIASNLKIPGFNEPQVDTLNLVVKWLSQEENGTWLMILDNADNSKIWDGSGSDSSETSIPLVTYLPYGNHCSILITTRDMQLGKVLSRVGRPKKPIEVFSFDSDNAIALLRSRISEDRDIDKQDAKELTEALSHLPLAITQAAAYLELNDMPVVKYIKLIDSTDLLSKENYDDSRDPDIQNSVFKTWKISFDQISQQFPRAGEILSLMAMFDRQGIPVKLLVNDEDEDKPVFDESISKLKAFSLIDEDSGNKTYGMHRMVYLSVQWYLRNQGSLTRWQEKAIESLHNSFPGSKYKNWGMIETLNPHAQIVLGYSSKEDSCLLQRASVKQKLAIYQSAHGEYASAIQYGSDSLNILEKILGAEHEDTIYSMSYLAWSFSEDGKLQNAENIIRRALNISTKQYSNPNPTQDITARHAGNLNIFAGILRLSERYEEAEAPMNQTVKLFTALFGPESIKTIGAIHDLALLNCSQEKYFKAEELLRKVLENITISYGIEDPLVLHAMQNLAIILSKQGRFEEEESLLHEVVSYRKKILGSKSANTLDSIGSLALSISNLQRYDEAKLIADECLENSMEALGPAHQGTIWVQNLVNYIDYVLAKQKDSQSSEAQEVNGTDTMDNQDEVSNSGSWKTVEEAPRWSEDGMAVVQDEENDGPGTNIQEIIRTLAISD